MLKVPKKAYFRQQFEVLFSIADSYDGGNNCIQEAWKELFKNILMQSMLELT